MSARLVSVEQAAELVRDGDVLWIGGSGAGHGVPQAFIDQLAARFTRSASPRDLTTVRVVGIGDFDERGMSQLALPGLTRRTIGSNIGNEPRLGALVAGDEIESYSFPQGVLSALCRDIAAGRPGHLTHVGLGTYVDPRQTGGRQNARTAEQLVQVVELAGREWLFYPALPVDVAVIRATTADEDGNLTFEREPILGDSLALAMAAHNSGGIVIVQAERLAARGSLRPNEVRIPGAIVDYVYVDERQRQTYNTAHSPFYSGELRMPSDAGPPTTLDVRKVIARRALLEFRPGDICNLGFGISQQIGAVAAEEGVADRLTLTVEQGIFGGVPAHGPDGGAGVNYQARLEQPSMFDFYDGGGLDITSLSFAQVDRHGNVNVHAFGERMRGPGGFLNISALTRRLCFVGTFTAGGLRVGLAGGAPAIEREGAQRKFVDTVREISFNGRMALEKGQTVRYVTERAVFALTPEGLELIEVADGLDVRKDVLAHMEFRPTVSERLRPMDARLFRAARMGITDDFATGERSRHGRTGQRDARRVRGDRAGQPADERGLPRADRSAP
ncbi:acyl CoA:acetate/3-ketoacid CoA transferase [Actinomadura rudentiformis]|uniref:3-oxoacid CoA-transferase n=1 Tax=Actinomadura rudentiformis TaxID=359158 RepID=A0A6H9YYS2_9ACTN|nr:CoA-transferase [Actinomadura rudentiformis]KAB2347887.1 3-oxoacid CoA-transferase [Actinomadura rudentiformis]